MPPPRLPPGRPALVCGPDGPLARAVVSAFAEAGARPALVALPGGADGAGRAWDEAERSVGAPRAVVSLPDAGGAGPAALARLAAERGADSFVAVVSAGGGPGGAVAVRSLVGELGGAALRVHVVALGEPEPAFRPTSPGGALMLDVAARLSPDDVGGLCVLLASEAGAAVASETVRLTSRSDLVRWLGGR